MRESRVKENVILFLSLVVAVGGYYFYQTYKKLEFIDSVFEKNRLLKDSFSHYRKLEFLKRGGQYFPDYEKPRTLNDKVVYFYENYFLKSPITKIIGTKYYAKKYVADVVGEDHVVKLYGVWDNPEDIEWDKLPSKFVLKSVRGNFGHQVIIVKDKSKMDISSVTNKLNEFCSTPGMKTIKSKRIIAEELLEPEGGLLVDYKFFCSYGRVLVADCMAREDNEITDVKFKSCSYYEIPEWKRIPMTIDNRQILEVDKPKNFDKMMEICEKLSANFPLIRIDLYEIGDRVLVGEITEDSSGGKAIFEKTEWDFKLGDQIPYVSKSEIAKIIKRDREVAGKYQEN